MNRSISGLLVASLVVATACLSHAQISYTGGVYSQNFNTLAGTTNNTAGEVWTDNSTLPGWYASKTTFSVTDGTLGGTAATFTPTNTAANVGLFSFGTASNTDRALGSRATSQVAGNDPVLYGVRLVNNTAQTITSFTVAYTGEQWFKTGKTTADTLVLDYQLGAAALSSGSWTNASAGTFTSPINTATAAIVAGNTAANRRGIAAKITGVSWAPGTELWVRFRDANESGEEQGLAVDDFFFFAEPESGLFFNGSTSYVTMGQGAAASSLNVSSFTIECRFMRTGPGVTASTGSGGITTALPLVAKGVGEGDGSNLDANYFLGIDNVTGKLVADFEQQNATNNGTAYPAGQNFPVFGSTILQNGVFYHVAATYDTATAAWKLYVNGVAETTTQTLPTFVGVVPRPDNIQGLGIGTTINSTGARSGFFHGVIDEVRIWNTARSAADILANQDLEIASGAAGLVARYGLDEGTGTSAAGTNAAGSATPVGTLAGSPLPMWVNTKSLVPNVVPTVSLTAPASGASVVFPAAIELTATAADSDGSIALVEFYQGTTKLGEDATAPYAFSWTGAAVGNYSLTAKAFDNSGASVTSASTTFEVTPNLNQPPVVTPAGPADGATGIGSTTTLALGIADPESGATTVTFYGRKITPATPGADFSIATLPDTQFYAENLNNNGRAATFSAQTEWLLANRNSALLPNLAFVSHMGDIVQNGDAVPAEWAVADTAIKVLENPATAFRAYGIPFGAAPGNHDQTSIGNAGGANVYFNQFFGTARYEGRNYWGGSQSTLNNNNNYQLFSASGLDFVIVHLEYDARSKSSYQAVLDWADSVLKAYPNRRAIITSHWIVNTGNPATFSTQGQAIYDDLKDNPNLFLMLCGHVAGEGQRADVFEGRTVYSILQDYQGRTNGGDGWLRYFVFSPANNTITAKTYRVSNPINSAAGTYETDTDSQFVLPYNMQSAVTDWIPLGTVNVAAAGTTAELLWTGLENSSDYEWYAVTTDGINSVNSPARRFSTAAAAVPVVALTAPANNSNAIAPSAVTLTAEATDADDAIAKVEFYQGGTKLGEDTTAPYQQSVTGLLVGNYAFTAIAVDASGHAAVSTPVNVAVTPSQAPVVTLTSPDAGDLIDALASLTLSADATDADGSITLVEFFNGATKLGEDTTAPFTFSWTGVMSGSYSLTARATDDANTATTSAAVVINVTNTDNSAPAVNLTLPAFATTTTIPVGSSITLAASATDLDGVIAKVEFYAGTSKLGEATVAPFQFIWTNIAAGTYSLTAVAIDNDGASTTSASATLVADPALWSYSQNFDGLGTGTSLATLPGWSFYGALGGSNSTWSDSIPIPANGIGGGTLSTTLTAATTFTTSSNTTGFNYALPASTSDRALGTAPTSGSGVVLQLALTNPTGAAINALRIGYDIRRFTAPATANELPGYWLFYSLDNGTTWTNVAALNPTLAGPTGVIVPNTIGVTTVAPTSFGLGSPWANGATLLLRWVDDNAVATSPDQIHGLDNLTLSLPLGATPTVSLTAPAANAVFVTPASFNLAATAADSDGTITKVEFYAGATKLGEDTEAPYAFTATGVTTGSYAYTAVATDNDGNTMTSAAVAVTVTAAPGSGTLLRGPYLNSATPTSMVVRWRSSQAVVGRVRYGTTPANLDQTLDESAAQTNHEVKLTGLTPYTRYYYSVGSALDTLTPEASDVTSVKTGNTGSASYTFAAPTSADYTFRTSPVTGTATDTRIWIVGDCGRGSATQAGGRNAYYNWMGNRVPDLNLQLGDNAYNSGTDTEYQSGYWQMYPTIFRKMPQWSCVGNHDANNGSTDPVANWPYYDMFTFPKAGEAGGVASGTEHYYSFNYGNIHFISLDSQSSSTTVDNPATSGVNEDGPMAAWLRQDLAANTATWTIVFFHHPPYSKGSHNSDTEGQMVTMRTNFNPILEAGGVDLVLTGHSHNYERSVLLDGHYGLSTTITPAMKLNVGNGSTTGFTTAFTISGDAGKIRNAANGFVATATVNGMVIPPDGAYIKPLTGPRDHFGAVYHTAGMSGQADGGSIDHTAMYISYDTVGTVNIDINGNTLVATYIQADGNTPDNYTIIKQGAADSDGDGLSDEYELANGLNRLSATDGAITADLDGDGLSNFLEFALGTAANSANASGEPGVPVATPGTGADLGKLQLAFTRLREEITYTVQGSNDLKTWSDLATNPVAVGENYVFTDANTTSPNRYLRLKATDGIVTDTTVPSGRVTLSLPQNQETPVAFPLSSTVSGLTGRATGFITAVGATTLDNSAAGWASGELSVAAAPYFVRITKGAAAGRLFLVSTSTANTATRLTVNAPGIDLTTLGLVAGTDTYELIPADTLGALFPTGTLQSGTATTGDLVRLWNGTAWLTYFHSGSTWVRQGAGAVADDTIVRPDQGITLLRRGPAKTYVITGRAPSTRAQIGVQRGRTNFVAGLPVDATFAELAVQTLPGWTSNLTKPTSGDNVQIWNGTAWLTYYHDGAKWVRQGTTASADTANAFRAGRPVLINRPTGSGTDILTQNKTY